MIEFLTSLLMLLIVGVATRYVARRWHAPRYEMVIYIECIRTAALVQGSPHARLNVSTGHGEPHQK